MLISNITILNLFALQTWHFKWWILCVARTHDNWHLKIIICFFVTPSIPIKVSRYFHLPNKWIGRNKQAGFYSLQILINGQGFKSTYHEYYSMTTLLTHTVAHSTKPSFRSKTNNQPLKKFLFLCSVEQKLSKLGRHFRK